MYTKLYKTIVDGTLYGRTKPLSVFFVLLALADEKGIVDVLPKKIADILGETEEFVNVGLRELEAPDKDSRTPTAEGRRILLLDEHRNWGWKITNYEDYRKIRNEEERRDYQRQWDRNNRKRQKKLSESDISDHVRPKTTNTEAEAEAEVLKSNTLSGLPPDVLPLSVDNSVAKHKISKANGQKFLEHAENVLTYLNTNAEKNFQFRTKNGKLSPNAEHIIARLKEGATLLQCREVIYYKIREWKGDEKMYKFLRPETLFNRTKFSQYIGEISQPEEEKNV